MVSETVAEELRALEERLAMPGEAESRASLAALLAADFREFGSSGRIYDAAATLEAIAPPAVRPRLVFEDFQALTVATDVVLVTYVSRSVAGPGWKPPALRSSLWCWREARWQLVFHQGTRLDAES